MWKYILSKHFTKQIFTYTNLDKTMKEDNSNLINYGAYLMIFVVVVILDKERT